MSSEVILAARFENYSKYVKSLLTRGRRAGILNFAKQRRLAASASPPAVREEVKTDFSKLPFPAVRCRADALWCPRFVIFRMEVL